MGSWELVCWSPGGETGADSQDPMDLQITGIMPAPR